MMSQPGMDALAPTFEPLGQASFGLSKDALAPTFDGPGQQQQFATWAAPQQFATQPAGPDPSRVHFASEPPIYVRTPSADILELPPEHAPTQGGLLLGAVRSMQQEAEQQQQQPGPVRVMNTSLLRQREEEASKLCWLEEDGLESRVRLMEDLIMRSNRLPPQDVKAAEKLRKAAEKLKEGAPDTGEATRQYHPFHLKGPYLRQDQSASLNEGFWVDPRRTIIDATSEKRHKMYMNRSPHWARLLAGDWVDECR